tara:strand:+ start:17865 stop:18539 length:675 start_codon:yes stop_codon:yes gene_type:complete
MTGCGINDSNVSDTLIESDFTESADSWEPFFTGYNVGWGDKMDLTSEYRSLPEPLNTNENGYFISAVNNSDDVKMLFRKQVSALEPNTTYQVNYTIRFATNAPAGCAGIGGSPGGSVKVIADATNQKPEAFIENDYYWLNTQYRHHDNPSQWHQNAILGDIANSQECEDENHQYEMKELTSGPAHSTVTTDDTGSAWLLFGTRSGFEGETALYFTYFSAEFSMN